MSLSLSATIYFSLGFIYLILDYLVSKQQHLFFKHILRFLFFLFFWPFILLKSLRLYLKIGKYLNPQARWQLFFTSKSISNHESFNGDTSQSNNFFNMKEKPPF